MLHLLLHYILDEDIAHLLHRICFTVLPVTFNNKLCIMDKIPGSKK